MHAFTKMRCNACNIECMYVLCNISKELDENPNEKSKNDIFSNYWFNPLRGQIFTFEFLTEN